MPLCVTAFLQKQLSAYLLSGEALRAPSSDEDHVRRQLVCLLPWTLALLSGELGAKRSERVHFWFQDAVKGKSLTSPTSLHSATSPVRRGFKGSVIYKKTKRFACFCASLRSCKSSSLLIS
jgi:hypothetical protein